MWHCREQRTLPMSLPFHFRSSPASVLCRFSTSHRISTSRHFHPCLFLAVPLSSPSVPPIPSPSLFPPCPAPIPSFSRPFPFLSVPLSFFSSHPIPFFFLTHSFLFPFQNLFVHFLAILRLSLMPLVSLPFFTVSVLRPRIPFPSSPIVSLPPLI